MRGWPVTEPLTPLDLAALRDLDERRTPGEWRASGKMVTADHGERGDCPIAEVWCYIGTENAAYIAAACNALPRLLATVDAQAAALTPMPCGHLPREMFPGPHPYCDGCHMWEEVERLTEETARLRRGDSAPALNPANLPEWPAAARRALNHGRIGEIRRALAEGLTVVASKDEEIARLTAALTTKDPPCS